MEELTEEEAVEEVDEFSKEFVHNLIDKIMMFMEVFIGQIGRAHV